VGAASLVALGGGAAGDGVLGAGVLGVVAGGVVEGVEVLVVGWLPAASVVVVGGAGAGTVAVSVLGGEPSAASAGALSAPPTPAAVRPPPARADRAARNALRRALFNGGMSADWSSLVRPMVWSASLAHYTRERPPEYISAANHESVKDS
jgi:hypothetical protein